MTFEEFQQKLVGAVSREKAYNLAVGYLKDRERFNWTGVYALEGQELVLRSFVGKPTDHVRIPVGRGICGTAVAEKRDINVPDVSKEKNYLACSLDTKSELVVLIKTGETIYGQIDIDSDQKAAFQPEDEAEVKKVADSIARYFALHRDLPERTAKPAAAPGVEPGVTSRDFYSRCSVCKGPIKWASAWYKCTVSTCNRTRVALQFCSTDCWDSHLPEARHRDPAFTEQRAPQKPHQR
jgi:L-methionine (R)-S-oxide reductase